MIETSEADTSEVVLPALPQGGIPEATVRTRVRGAQV